MDVDKLKAIYEQAKERTREYNKFVEDATERASEFGGLAFHNYDSGFTIQIAAWAYDQMHKLKMENFIGKLSETGYIHASFDYENIRVVVCFSLEEVKK